jgi:phospholipid-binding lipoprotein MlaA
MRAILVLALAAMLGGCATTGGSLAENDPYEGVNRGVWEFNQAVDTVAVKPATTVYRTVTPVPARRGLSRVLSNLSEPFSFINNLLQGKPERAFNSLGRFLINSTIGVGGLADHATDLGLPPTPEDFGQTLAVSGGAKNSPYLVLPLLGPSTVRDAVGTAVEMFGDPARIVLNSELSSSEEYMVTGARVLDGRSRLMESGAESVLETSADPYATARSAYLQRREAQIRDEAVGSATLTPDEQNQLLNEALEQDAVMPAPVIEEDAPGSEAENEPENPDSGPETTSLDRLPSNVLRNAAVSGGNNN